jgi:hypothetical protein
MATSRRVDKDGDVTKVIRVNVTVPIALYEELFALTLKERVTLNKVVRAALLVGTSKMRGEYARMERGEENKVGKLREMYRQDKRLGDSAKEARKSLE